MLPRPLQVGANVQRQTMGVQPQMAPSTYAQVAQMPLHQVAPHQAATHQAAAHQAAPRSVEMTRRRQEITHGKRATDVPQAAGD